MVPGGVYNIPKNVWVGRRKIRRHIAPNRNPVELEVRIFFTVAPFFNFLSLSALLSFHSYIFLVVSLTEVTQNSKLAVSYDPQTMV